MYEPDIDWPVKVRCGRLPSYQLDHRTAFDVCSASPLLCMSPAVCEAEQYRPHFCQKSNRQLFGKSYPAGHQEHCKTLWWLCWISGSQPPRWQWKFDGRNNTSTVYASTYFDLTSDRVLVAVGVVAAVATSSSGLNCCRHCAARQSYRFTLSSRTMAMSPSRTDVKHVTSALPTRHICHSIYAFTLAWNPTSARHVCSAHNQLFLLDQNSLLSFVYFIICERVILIGIW